MKQIDFKIKGTKLPMIPDGTLFACSEWKEYEELRDISKKIDLVSFGKCTWRGELCILAEREEYGLNNYYIFKESDIIRLAEEQGVFEEEVKLIGYKIKDEFLDVVDKLTSYDFKGNVTPKTKLDFIYGSATYFEFEKAKVLDLWCDPVYEEVKKLPTINGYDGKIDGEIVSYGCAKFDLFKLRGILSSMKSWDDAKEDPCNTPHNRSIKLITLNSGVSITMDEINQIVEYVDSL